ncbi:MAG: hypothetical protein IPJ65_08630 [Archangiaceae bacterium]|nr:hypothetical protein [Archangiaceae bacterium]
MLALVTAALLGGTDSLAAFTLEVRGKPGVFVLSAQEEPRVRLGLTVTPWPPPAGVSNARAEIAVTADPEVVPRALAVLEKRSSEPRTAAPPFPLQGFAALAARISAAADARDGASLGFEGTQTNLVLNPKNSAATFESIDAAFLRRLEAALKPAQRPGVPLARLDDVERIAGPGAEPLWSGRKLLLYLEGRALKLYDADTNRSRSLGPRSGTPMMSACAAGVCALAETPTRIAVVGGPRPELVNLPRPLSLANAPPGRRLWLSADGQWVGAELYADPDDDRQHLWFYDRLARRAVSWAGPGDTGHALSFTTWGTRGVLFSRTAPCREGDPETVNDAACLFELDAGRLAPVGNARTVPPPLTAPDRGHRLSWASAAPVIEPLDGGAVLQLPALDGSGAMSPVWLSGALLLVAADPLATIDLAGVKRRVLDDRLQFAGGQLEGARVWYQTAEGLFSARVISAL